MVREKKFDKKQFMEKIYNILDLESLRVTIDCSVQSGMVVGTMSALGGLLLGPRGVAMGGVLGSLGAAYFMKRTFKSVPDVIREDLTQEQRDLLCKVIQDWLCGLNIVDTANLTALSISNGSLKKQLIKKICKFLENLNYTMENKSK